LTIISYNIAVVAYVSYEISTAKSLEALSNLGELAFSFSQIALEVRSADIQIRLNLPYNLTGLSQAIIATESLKNSILENYTSFNFCPASKIVSSTSGVNFWTYNEQPGNDANSLIEIIETYLQAVRLI
jgi:hypothetical protein